MKTSLSLAAASNRLQLTCCGIIPCTSLRADILALPLLQTAVLKAAFAVGFPPQASPALKMTAQISKKRKFVADGVFRAELNDFFTRELSEEGYSGCDVRVTHARTEIIIRATHTQEVLGEKGRRIRELTALVQKRFKFPENSLELYAEKVQYRGLSAIAQCESLRYKLLGGLAVRRACYGVLRFVMESGAKGCEVVVSARCRFRRLRSQARHAQAGCTWYQSQNHEGLGSRGSRWSPQASTRLRPDPRASSRQDRRGAHIRAARARGCRATGTSCRGACGIPASGNAPADVRATCCFLIPFVCFIWVYEIMTNTTTYW
ncbi:40S ribosomal protein S3 [Grifola frondosa]|uniref:40S ribosomal protein S3 n=1 Tax=Grifola frondosa TaxID=5627 RepID=A0A1C7M300_GRIFR|nr:40S ribosomal protein S3 [Grifola frondosa]